MYPLVTSRTIVFVCILRTLRTWHVLPDPHADRPVNGELQARHAATSSLGCCLPDLQLSFTFRQLRATSVTTMSFFTIVSTTNFPNGINPFVHFLLNTANLSSPRVHPIDLEVNMGPIRVGRPGKRYGTWSLDPNPNPTGKKARHQLVLDSSRSMLTASWINVVDGSEPFYPHHSPKTANSDLLLRLAVSARNLEGNDGVAEQPFISLLLGQLPRRTLAQVLLRRACNLLAVSCKCLRRSLSSDGGKHRPLRAAGSRRERRLWHRLHCSIDLSLRVRSRDTALSDSSKVDMGPMSFPCWHAVASEERLRWA